MSRTVRWPQYVAGMSASGGALAIGTALGWSSPVASRLLDEVQYFPMTQNQFDWVASILTLGCAISCLPIGFLMNAFGRKWTMLGLVVPFIVGWSLVIWARNFLMLFVGRFVIGLAGGAFCVSAPQYSAEIAEKEIRGTIGSFFQLLIISGILFVYMIGPFMPVFWTNVVCGLIPLAFGVVFFFMPETPVYLVIKKREAEAVKSYKWLRGDSYDPQWEIDELNAELVKAQSEKTSLKEAFKKRSSVLALIIANGLMLFQQTSGINIVLFYSTIIFKAASTGFNSDISTIIVGAVHVAATFASSLLVDKVGRKILLLISIVTITVSLVALGVFFYIKDYDTGMAENLSWLPLTSLSVFIIAYALGLGPVSWLMLSEVYSKDINAIAAPISGAFKYFLAFLITATFNSMSDAIGIGQTFWIFAGLSAIGTIFVIAVIPETKGKSMADIQRMLNGVKQVEDFNISK